MVDRSYRDRFQRLEIPEEARRIDWGFLEAALALPDPLPLMEHRLLVLVNGHALVPGSAEAPGASWMRLYDLTRPLVPLASLSELERGWLSTHEAALQRAVRRFVDAAPTAVLRDPGLVREAIGLLRGHARDDRDDLDADKALATPGSPDLAPTPAASLLSRRIVGHGRFLRLHHKLYNLVTLREYVRVFERAIEPTFFRSLQELPDTTGPEVFLQRIEGALDRIHAKARSPLRNKMQTSRLAIDGITLLPIYVDDASGLFGTYAENLELHLKIEALSPHAQG